MDFNLRINDLWSDAAKEMAAHILRPDGARAIVSKCFIVDYTVDDQSVDTKLFDYDTQQPQAEAFCKSVKDRGGAVNIKTREVGSPSYGAVRMAGEAVLPRMDALAEPLHARGTVHPGAVEKVVKAAFVKHAISISPELVKLAVEEYLKVYDALPSITTTDAE